MGTIKTTNIEPIADNGTVTLGSSGDTFTLGSGVKQSNLMYPAFAAYLSADQTVSDATYTKAELDTKLLDTDNCYDNSTNYRFTPTVAGKYFVYGQVRGDSTGSNSLARVITNIYKNGTRVAESQIYPSAANYSNVISSFTSVILDMNGSSDYIELFGYIDASSGTPVINGASSLRTHLGAYRIGS